MSEEDNVFETGEVVADRYEVVEELGRGSYGVVYRAIQLGIGRDVALKTLLPHTPVDSEEHQRFEREALVISRFNHPNIVTLYDYGEHDGVLFMVMEYIEGRTLRSVIEEEAPLQPDRTRGIVNQILDALQYAHDKNVVHRDLKPANVQLVDNPSIDTVGEKELVKVLDFGIAKIVHGEEDAGALDTLTQTGIAMGTPQYMSPENITGDPVTHHADLYAVGLVLYEMLTGELVFEGSDAQQVMVAHIKDAPPKLPDTAGNRPFRRAVKWALKKQPDERVQTARQFREVLDEDAPRPPEPATSPQPVQQRRLVKPLAAVTMAASVVILLLVVTMFQLGDGDEDPPEQEDPQQAVTQQESADEQRVDEAMDVASASVDQAVDEQRQVQLDIITEPEGAEVLIDGDDAGKSPLTERVARGEEPLEVTLRLDDEEVVERVVPDRSRTLEVELKR